MLGILDKIETRRLSAPVAAEATDITNATAVVCANYEVFRFNVAFGVITAGAATSVEIHGSVDGGSNFTILKDQHGDDCKLTVDDDMDSKIVSIEIIRPTGNVDQLKPVIKRATQNAVVELVWADLGNPRSYPVAQPAASVAASVSFVGCEP